MVSGKGIYLICGPMRSGKSNYLLIQCDKLKYAKRPYVIFKLRNDRFNQEISTRYFNRSETAISIDKSEDIYKHIDINNIPKDMVVIIDEGQFFDMGLVDVVKKLNSLGIAFIIAGLDLDASGKTFGPMGDLLALATHVEKITAICEVCRKESVRTGFRKNIPDFFSNNFVPDETNFSTVCLECFYSGKKPSASN